LLTRLGLILVAASILTYWYYFQILPTDISILVLGGSLVIISYILFKSLKSPKYGFEANKVKNITKERINIKSLVVTQLAGRGKAVATGAEFGEGSFGGGGAGGKY
jgi:uncharacterized membrane protein YgcG